MRKQFFITSFLLALIASLLGSKSLADPNDLSETEERAALVRISISKGLTKESYQLAGELGLIDLLTRLQSLSEHERHKHGTPLSAESTTLRLEITEVIITTMLQCQAVIAQIESETATAIAIKNALEGKRSRTSRTNAMSNVLANGGISSVGNMLQMPFETVPDSRYEFPGEIVESAGTLLVTAMGGIALHQSKGVALSSSVEPNMLAKVFKRPNDARTEYPDVIWNYLNSVPPGSSIGSATRRQLLIQRWVALRRIPPPDTEKGREYVRTLAGTIPQKKSITIDMLDDRAAMLLDLRAEVNQIYKELLNMMLVIRAL